MSGSSPRIKVEILVVGGGVLGLCTAVELTRRGHDVALVDASLTDSGRANASSVAAGMIAPAMEAVLDGATPERAALLRRARRAWDAFGVPLAPGPAIWRGADADAVAARLEDLGFVTTREGADVLAPEDARVEVETAMAALRTRIARPPIADVVDSVVRVGAGSGGGWRVMVGGAAFDAEHLILATGVASAIPGLPESLARTIDAIQPIQGQIGWTARGLTQQVLRGPGAYVAPWAGGAVIGATMAPGRRDLAPDEQAGRAMVAAAGATLGRDLEGLDIDWRVGVRGATADGLPLAGPTGEPGLHLALAPRRNGWLLAPLVAGVVADGVEGRAAAPHAAALDPRRFLA